MDRSPGLAGRTGQAVRPVFLEAGKRYTLEAFMAEGGGLDNLAVRWQPGGTIEEPIPAARSSRSPGWGTQPVLEDVASPVLIPGFDVELAQREPGTEVRFEILQQPANGTLSITGTSRWWFDILTNVVYQPSGGFNGTTLYLSADRSRRKCVPARHDHLEVAGANDPPVVALPIAEINVLEDEIDPGHSLRRHRRRPFGRSPGLPVRGDHPGLRPPPPPAIRRRVGGSGINRTMTLTPRVGKSAR